MANTHGKASIQVMSDAQTLPNAGTALSTNFAYISGSAGRDKANAGLCVSVYANTDITIATAQKLVIEILSYTSDTSGSEDQPFWYDNSGTITRQSNAHYYPLYKDSGDGELKFSAGDPITQFVIPPEQLYKDDYVRIKYVTDADESSEKVDAFLHPIA